MIFRDLLFFFTEAYLSLRRSSFMLLVAVATITVSLVVFGSFLLVMLNINHLAGFLASKLEVRVYLKKELAPDAVSAFGEKLKVIAGVRNVEFVTKEKAWKDFQTSYPSLHLDDLVSENPLPDSYRLQLAGNRDTGRIVAYLKGFNTEVDDAVYGGDVADRIDNFSRLLRLAGLGIVILLAVATLMIVVNTIRLTVIARHEEITIMRLVGATNGFIKGPFIVEGLFMGLMGSGLSVLLLKLSYGFLGGKLQESVPYFPLVHEAYPLTLVYAGVGGLGAFLGILGAYVSVSRSLKSTT